LLAVRRTGLLELRLAGLEAEARPSCIGGNSIALGSSQFVY